MVLKLFAAYYLFVVLFLPPPPFGWRKFIRFVCVKIKTIQISRSLPSPSSSSLFYHKGLELFNNSLAFRHDGDKRLLKLCYSCWLSIKCVSVSTIGFSKYEKKKEKDQYFWDVWTHSGDVDINLLLTSSHIQNVSVIYWNIKANIFLDSYDMNNLLFNRNLIKVHFFISPPRF